MKVIQLLMLVFGSLLFAPVMAQKDSSGVYVTAADFQQKKLTYAINYKTQKHKIKDNMLFNGGQVKVVHDGQTYTMEKNNTYGFKDTKGVVFRFVDDNDYTVLNPGETLLMYSYPEALAPVKGIAKNKLLYYFSKDVSAAPQSLTKENLKAAYPDNHPFHDALDAQFKNDADLYTYDSFHKMYKLNHLLSVSMN